MALRRQLAAYSPVPATAVLGALRAAVEVRRDPRPAVCDLLLREFGADDVVLCASGTQALQIAISLLRARLGAGTSVPVALPAFSCFDVASAAVGAGGPIALYDLDPATLAPDEDSLERVLAGGARIVVAAPLYGIPIPWEPFVERVARHGAVLIEDAAQGHGASWNGRALGTLGTTSTLSFGRGKGWTGGGGGAVLTRGGDRLHSIRLDESSAAGEAALVFGLVAQNVFGRPALYGIPSSIPALGLGETTYKAPTVPVSMARAAAGALLSTCATSTREAQQRRENAAGMLARLAAAGRVLPIRAPQGAVPGYLRLPLRISGGLGAARAVMRAGAHGVTRSYPSTLAALPAVVSRLVDIERRWPGAETLVRELITVPTHSLVSSGEAEEIARLLTDAPAK
jgi:dTDP-4-amino-4,6-dideoxygalactose transaminase